MLQLPHNVHAPGCGGNGSCLVLHGLLRLRQSQVREDRSSKARYFRSRNYSAVRPSSLCATANLIVPCCSWLDKTPTARIIARCTGDIQTCMFIFSRRLCSFVSPTNVSTVDVGIAGATEQFVDSTIYMLLKMFAVVLFSPIFVVPAIMVALAGCACGNVFMRAKLSVKRELSTSKAPVLSHFGAAISGISEYIFRGRAYCLCSLPICSIDQGIRRTGGIQKNRIRSYR